MSGLVAVSGSVPPGPGVVTVLPDRHPTSRRILRAVTDEREPNQPAGYVRKLAHRVRETDRHGPTVRTLHTLRRHAPGGEAADEHRWHGARTSDRVARLITEAAGQHPSVTRELGLTALQVWQAAARSRRGGHEDERERTIVFTDLVAFSEWALHAGDEHVLWLLREVGRVSEQAITERGGAVVKSLGDGLMAVFDDTAAAVAAVDAACAAVSAITCDEYRPRLRVGLHRGAPRHVRGDYLGVDVNIAARVAGAASGSEVLISGPALAELDTDRYSVRRRRRFRAKGTPRDLDVYSIVPRHPHSR